MMLKMKSLYKYSYIIFVLDYIYINALYSIFYIYTHVHNTYSTSNESNTLLISISDIG